MMKFVNACRLPTLVDVRRIPTDATFSATMSWLVSWWLQRTAHGDRSWRLAMAAAASSSSTVLCRSMMWISFFSMKVPETILGVRCASGDRSATGTVMLKSGGGALQFNSLINFNSLYPTTQVAAGFRSREGLFPRRGNRAVIRDIYIIWVVRLVL